MLEVAAVVTGCECQGEADDDHALAGPTEPADEHVDELRDRLAAARVVGGGCFGERRRRRPMPNSSAPTTASRTPLTRMACTWSLDFQITSASNAIPIRNIGM